ncbi:hypothetical protein K438DRAFT_2070410 [Mycena galopus ATCC 62051]|nr:hypothetical protein K438DRAFT_2070410 [Mycena galopus ATCC 62051]
MNLEIWPGESLALIVKHTYKNNQNSHQNRYCDLNWYSWVSERQTLAEWTLLARHSVTVKKQVRKRQQEKSKHFGREEISPKIFPSILAAVTFAQGTMERLTNPQIMTSPTISDGVDLFGDGNVPVAFAAFPRSTFAINSAHGLNYLGLRMSYAESMCMPFSSVHNLGFDALVDVSDQCTKAHMRGHTGAGGGDTKLLTVHQNTITTVRAYQAQGGRVSQISTSASGVDGNLIIT